MTFDEKLAKWKARGPRPHKQDPRTRWFRAASQRIPDAEFRAHVEATTAGRREYEAGLIGPCGRRDGR